MEIKCFHDLKLYSGERVCVVRSREWVRDQEGGVR
jgi:hypothetical protein